MHETALSLFKTEIRHFFLISLLNLVFAAVTMAFGITTIVQQMIPVLEAFPSVLSLNFSPIILIVAGVAILVGFRWILASITIFEGVETLNDECAEKGSTITDEDLTGLIVRMLAHYRMNKDTIKTMILVCTLGGCCFFIFGIFNCIDYLTSRWIGAQFTIDAYFLIFSIIFAFGFSITCLYSSNYFSRFSAIWDLRLIEIEQSEGTLKKTMGLDPK